NVTFTLTVSNAGPNGATGVTVSDPLPSGYTYVSDTGGGAYNSGTGLWTVGAVASGGSAALGITATVLASGSYTNGAQVQASNQADPDSTPGNGVGNGEDDQASVTVTPGAVADLSLTKTSSNPSPNVGSNVTFTLTVSNAGPNGATGVTVSDPLPSGYTYVSDTGGGAYNQGSGIWTVGALAIGASATLDITATVLASGSYTNGAQVQASNQPDSDSTPGNGVGNGEDDQASVTLTPVVLGFVTLTKSATHNEVSVGGLADYAVTLQNVSGGALTGVTVGDRMPAGFSFADGSARLVRAGLDTRIGTADDVLTPLAGSGAAPLLLGPFDLAAGEVVEVRYVLRVGSGVVPGEHTNRATPLQGIVPIGNTGSASVEVQLDPTLDLSVVSGKVFGDTNRNGLQDDDEPGVSGAMVALDDGTYAITDDHGLYHFPAVKPGQRMIKLNLHSLVPGTVATTDPGVVLWITPGLIAKATFGVVTAKETESIGRPAIKGLAVTSEAVEQPLEVQGSAEAIAAMINGRSLPFPSADVQLAIANLDDIIEVGTTRLTDPATFDLTIDPANGVAGWAMTILDQNGAPFRVYQGKGAPPARLTWDGRSDDGTLVTAGGIYGYQLEIRFKDGTRSTSPRRVFGVNRSNVVSIRLTGDAFETGKAVLSERARQALGEAALALKGIPNQKIVIEGHTDTTGTNSFNQTLSRRRAEAAAEFLTKNLGFDPDQVVTAGYGSDRPLAPNDTPEGRTLNRRVEIRAEVKKVTRADLKDHYRTEPGVQVNDQPVEVNRSGRFRTEVPAGAADQVTVSVNDSEGRSAQATVPLPPLEIVQPRGRQVIAFGDQSGVCRAEPAPDPGQERGQGDDGRPAVVCRLRGTTRSGMHVELDGSALAVGPEGSFASEVRLRLGETVLGLVASDSQGNTRIASLEVHVTDRDDKGLLVIAEEAIPNLSVDLPPAGATLTSPHLGLSGRADPGSRVEVNGLPLGVAADGSFTGRIDLPAGESKLILRVIDRDGRTGQIERPVRVGPPPLFLMALADGTFGRLDGKGMVSTAGLDAADRYYFEGRVAYYLKGTIAGKYLITSAFDSDRNQVSTPFKDLDIDESRRLLTNLDPDKFYPIYGDGSAVTYDAESQGKLYLALESDEIQALVGNYSLALNQAELARYQRTLHGGRFVYRSLADTRYGEPDTQVVLFTADVQHVHIRDELRATGGSLYYLSQRNVVEGSEEVTVVVRDKNTGLTLSRDRMRQNVDYSIKYEEGRLAFQRPVSSVAPSGSLVDSEPLSGHPVFIQVDYDTVVGAFERTVSGARARQQLGDHVAVGATYVDDRLGASPYELKGADAEIRLGTNSKISAEYADSDGVDSTLFVSEDGGVSYTGVSTTGAETGSAWKASADLDLGEWAGRSDRYRLRLYDKQIDQGFFSNGNRAEQGTDKKGANLDLKIADGDMLSVRYDREERLGVSLPGAVAESVVGSTQWDHKRERWGFGVEFLDKETADAAGASLTRDRFGSVRFWSKITQRFLAGLERQQTISGKDNDQTTLDLEYRALRSLSLTARATEGSLGRAVQAGAVLKAVGGEVYLAERLADDRLGERTSTVLGAKSPLGPSSKVYTEYQWEDGEHGPRRVSLLGLQRQWDAGPGFKFILSGETADVVGGPLISKRSAGTASVSYANRSLTASTRDQIRFEESSARTVQYLTVNNIDYRLNSDFSLLGRYRYTETRDRDTDLVEARFDERTVGLAYRPVRHDRFNALTRYTRVLDLRPPGTGQTEAVERLLEIFSLDTAFDLTTRLQWLSKLAWRAQTEAFGTLAAARSRASLTVQRVNVKIAGPLEGGIEYRVLAETEGGDRRQGWLSEVMWEVHKSVRVGGGFNFTDFTDNALSTNDYSARGWFFRVQGRY
ncbi:MAG TPA: OmpA family protein, partial [Candidatus Polarisedimenticolia bacterium]|nr:OmpA family protein [Candidatus Polarisedimenticolia bacterium]